MTNPTSSTQGSERGTYRFEISGDGNVLFNLNNLEKLRALLLDKAIVHNALGPGDSGDFDHGAWHVFCHLAAGCAVMRRPTGDLLWVEISHLPTIDLYVATVTIDCSNECVTTFPLDSTEGHALVLGAKVLGFVEGSSLGHISARSARDSSDMFNGCLRQDFDQEIGSPKDGGRVWEHWCTSRNIRPDNPIGTSVLRAFLAMVALLGGCFVAAVARGRTDHDHPTQLAALVNAGFLSEDEALIDISPLAIPMEVERLICSASVDNCIAGAKCLVWQWSALSYHMFARRLESWNTINNMQKILQSQV